MSESGTIPRGDFSHEVLFHRGHDELVEGITRYVEHGLAAGGRVMIHGSADHLRTMHRVLGPRPEVDYHLTEELFGSPLRRLFAIQRELASSREPVQWWAVGTVPPVPDRDARVRWAHFEALINAVLDRYCFHALCTYDTQALPAPAIAAAKATHPWITDAGHRRRSQDYLLPSQFLSTRLGGTLGRPPYAPLLQMTLEELDDLTHARDQVARNAIAASAVARETIFDFLTAVNEVTVNALQHGRSPVEIRLWVEPAKLTCQITDRGPGIPDILAGCRYPERPGSRGLWVARQLCDDVIITNPPEGGCKVLLTTS
jgi:anti-sigma regulatory factor (Ser/Thr protein kinase)